MNKVWTVVCSAVLAVSVGTATVTGVLYGQKARSLDDATRQLDELNAQVTRLTEENGELSQNNDSLQSDSDTLTGELAQKTEALTIAEGDIEALNTALTDSQSKVTELTAQLTQAQNDLENNLKVNSTIDELTNQLAVAQGDIAEAKLLADSRLDTVQDLQNQLNECQNNLTQKEKDYEDLSGRLTAAEEDLAGKSALLKEATDAQEANAVAVAALTVERDDLKVKADELSKTNAALTTEQENLKAQIDTLTAANADIPALQEKLSSAEGRVEELTAERDSLKSQVDTLTAANADVAALQSKLETAESNLAMVITERDELKSRVGELTAANADAEALLKELDTAKTNIEDLTAQCDELNARIEELTAANADVEALRTELEAVTGQRDSLQEQITQLQNRLAALESTSDDVVFDATESMNAQLTMPVGTQVTMFNGTLQIISADAKAQAQLMLLADENGTAYTPNDMDIALLVEKVADELTAQGAAFKKVDTDSPIGTQLICETEDGIDATWLFTGVSRLYGLEIMGEKEAVQALLDDIAAGLTLS